MAPNPPDPIDWPDRARYTLSRYDEPLLRAVAARLIKPRTNQPVDELLDKSVAALANAPVVDRRVKDLPAPSRALLAVIGLSRQPRWRVGHLINVLAALGHPAEFAPIQAAMEAGLLFPEVNPLAPPVADFASWLGSNGTLAAGVFAHPTVAARARGEDLGLPDLSDPEAAAGGAARVADGLEWPLRLAAVWQQVGAGPVRLTQGNTLFKRDQTRLQADEVLTAPPADQLAVVPEPGVLALLWSEATELLEETDGELRAAPFPVTWDVGLIPTLVDLFAALPRLEAWDPVAGYRPGDNGVSPFPSAALLSLLLVARGTGVDPAAVAAWLWDHHPSWAGGLTKDSGTAWVEAFLLGVAYHLRLVEAKPAGNGWRVRLADLGRHLFAGGPEPTPPPAFPQTLLVQPNAEVLAYRQGLTPSLIASLSRFARWKGIGPACTLELTPEQTYRGLETGLTLPLIVQTLNRHGTRPVPANVADLLQRWANKRDRITVFSSAVLVEFPTPTDLDLAVSRGIVTVRLTDRIGMTADGKEPALSQLRLIGNRDYEAKPQKCVTVSDDGVTLTIDAAQADLLLEAEIGRFADPLPDDGPGRRFRLSPASVRRTAEQGMSLSDVDNWFGARTGQPLSPAGRLFLLGPQLPPPAAGRRVVVRFPTAELADGVVQWPATAALVADRLGPTAVVVDAEHVEAFRDVLSGIGVPLELEPGMNGEPVVELG
jgi:hypothetical protein